MSNNSPASSPRAGRTTLHPPVVAAAGLPNANVAPNDLYLYARVVQEGSFSRAAERMGLPKSTVSRHIAALEAQLGERLLLRTTRKLTVTDFGNAVLEFARHVVDDVAAATSLAQNRQSEPSGRLRVTMPGDIANVFLATFLADFVVAHPAISLEIDLSARFVDLIGENFDVAIRMGELRDDASLSARRLAVLSGSLYAAPRYLAARGSPATPDELMKHDALRVLARGGEPMAWTLSRGKDRWEGIPPGRVTANSPAVLMRMAVAGAGITVVNDHFALPYLQRGELAQVLADWDLPPVPAWAVFPGRRLMPARTRAFIDAAAAHFSGPGCTKAEDDARTAKAALRARGARRR